VKYRQLYVSRATGDPSLDRYDQILLHDGTSRRLTTGEIAGATPMPPGRRYQLTSLLSEGESSTPQEFEFNGKKYRPRAGTHWKTSVEGLARLAEQDRIEVMGSVLRYRRFVDDFPVIPITDRWESTQLGVELMYVVQTSPQVVQRCLLMTTDPGDLVLDPTCGSGTTAYVAEQWGRQWITIDTSRVPLALARQRLLTATFPYYELSDEQAGPSGGFKYERKQNNKGEEVGGIVPHITLKSIANNEPPQEEVLVDRPNMVSSIVRVSGPFVVEATIPTPVDFEADGIEDSGTASAEDHGDHVSRMLEALRKSPVLRLPGNQTVTFKNVRAPATAMVLHAEAEIPIPTLRDLVDEATGQPSLGLEPGKPVAFVFGPASSAVSEQLVFQAAREANMKNYAHLYVIGFACQDAARKLIQNCAQVAGVPATYVNATMDIQMGDLLKSTKASHLFSVTGAPEVRIVRLQKKLPDEEQLYRVELSGLDVYYPPGYDPTDPTKDDVLHQSGENVPAWFLDTDYNDLCFYVSQAFFPRTAAWDNLKRALKAQYEDSVWEHFAGTVSEPFAAGENGKIAVKVIDDRGNELLVVKSLSEAEEEK
jgi:adenine-specific DNA-methyltransferase